jgi:hypothetical protein
MASGFRIGFGDNNLILPPFFGTTQNPTFQDLTPSPVFFFLARRFLFFMVMGIPAR